MTMPVPNPATWPIRNPPYVYAGDLNTNVRDLTKFLATERPLCFAQQQSPTQSLTSQNAPSFITMDSVIADTAMGFNTANASQYVIQAAGWYLIGGQVAFASTSSATNFGCGIGINGTNNSSLGTGFWGDSSAGPASSGLLCPGVMDLLHCSQGDIIQIAGYQWSGAAISTRVTLTSPFVQSQMIGYYVAEFNPGWTAVTTIPSPRTWTSGDLAGSPSAAAAIMNQELKTNAQFLLYPPIFRAHANSGQSIPASTVTNVTLANTDVDNVSAWNSGTNTWTCKVPGLYAIGGTICLSAPTAYDGVQALITVNGGQLLGKAAGSNPSFGCNVNVWMMYRFALNDTLQLSTFANQALTVAGGSATNVTRLWTAWLAK